MILTSLGINRRGLLYFLPKYIYLRDFGHFLINLLKFELLQKEINSTLSGKLSIVLSKCCPKYIFFNFGGKL